MSHPLQATIEALWERRTELSPASDAAQVATINEVIDQLDSGALRVAEKVGGEWITHQWIKKAVLLSFRVRDNRVQEAGDIRYFDKVDTKFEGWSEERFREGGFRVVPGTIVRKGAFVARNAVLMPSFVNIGGYVDEATMVDTWVTVGSCAQIGKNVHLSGGVG
ncbi:MAG TPA: 2,3,4,5-tetrahydropyridine-2,6-dicarboxylate N-succinyltransferase, partial [Rhodocyclaceae bacterium]|nr:2,3,4,5-tetrahydropyridine-2,6-dicarboxylate N-succinyltransferase [Rhodocyclaceae bacterium]